MQQGCLVYSFGSENKFDFELALLEHIGPHCEVHTFDHTVGLNPTHQPEGVHFHPWGLGNRGESEATIKRIRDLEEYEPCICLKSLDQIVTDLNHWGRRIDVLKIDVEGAEFDTLPEQLGDGTFDKMNIR